MADDSKAPASKTSTGGLRTDTYGKATSAKTDAGNDPMKDPKLNQFADLEPGDSKVVDSGGTELQVPGVPPTDEVVDEAKERRDAGIPEPPKPALYTDLHATSGGYQVTPAGVSPEELQARADRNTRQ